MLPYGESRLENVELDLAVMNTLVCLRDGFTVHELDKERYVVIFPPEHRLAKFNAVKLGDLSGDPMLIVCPVECVRS